MAVVLKAKATAKDAKGNVVGSKTLDPQDLPAYLNALGRTNDLPGLVVELSDLMTGERPKPAKAPEATPAPQNGNRPGPTAVKR
jgi:hypothetical protein